MKAAANDTGATLPAICLEACDKCSRKRVTIATTNDADLGFRGAPKMRQTPLITIALFRDSVKGVGPFSHV